MRLLHIVGIAVWLVAAFVTVGWIYGLRKVAVKGVTRQTVNSAMLFFVAVVIVPLLGISPLHLFWMFPVSWLCGTLSLGFPFSLLSIFGRVFFALCSIGVRRKAG
jgi:hypothetical protein